MARRFLTSIDMTGFALIGALMNPRTTDPAGLGVQDAGQVWFRSDTGRLMFWNGTAAIDVMDLAATHGSLVASRISDLAATVHAYRLNQFAAPDGPLNAGGQRIANVGDPTSAADAVSLQYLESQLSGMTSGQILKGSVRVASTANVSLSSPGATIDGVTMAANDIVLLAGQTDATQNGPWVWTAAGTALSRPQNWNSDATAQLGSYWIVREGSQADTFGLLTNDAPITLGTTPITIIFRGAAGATYTAGAGLLLSGTEFAVGAGNGIVADADAVRVDAAVVGRKVTGVIPTASGGIFTVAGPTVTINHQLGNAAPQVAVRYGSGGSVPGALVEVDDSAPDANNVTLTFPEAPANQQYVFSVIG